MVSTFSTDTTHNLFRLFDGDVLFQQMFSPEERTSVVKWDDANGSKYSLKVFL